jgi:hypothetical protein
MYHEADATFWNAALKNFPALPHLTKVQIIYHYRGTSKVFNTSCWDRLDYILSNRNMFPRLEVVDICPTFRSQRLGSQKIFSIRNALQSLGTFGCKVRLTHWGKTCEIVFVLLGVFWCSSFFFFRNLAWYI